MIRLGCVAALVGILGLFSLMFYCSIVMFVCGIKGGDYTFDRVADIVLGLIGSIIMGSIIILTICLPLMEALHQ
jgi:hypothetical protein